MKWINCDVKFANAANYIGVACNLDWFGGSILAGGTAPTGGLIRQQSHASVLRNLDLSNLGANPIYANPAAAVQCDVRIINCIMASSFTLQAAGTVIGESTRLYNTDSGATNYLMWVATGLWSVKTETSVVFTGGAVDGASGTPISWKLIAGTNAEYPPIYCVSPDICIWNETTGSAITVTVEFLIDSAVTLTNADVWMEVDHLGTSSSTLGVRDLDSKVANALTTASTCTTGAGLGSWANDSGTGNSYKLVSTITPQNRGYITARVCVAKACTIYINPKITVA